MTIICSIPIADSDSLCEILDALAGHNLPCQVYNGVLTVRFTGSRASSERIMALFENLPEYRIVVLSQRAWKEDR